MFTPDDAKPDGCQEASLFNPIPDVYLPCNQPAVRRVYHSREDRTYRMCAPCADHNITRRGAEDRGPYIQPDDENAPEEPYHGG